MNIWMKCNACNFHEHKKFGGGSFSTNGCPKCDSFDTRLVLGGAKPEWYKPEQKEQSK